uniref:DDHD domain-containing protein n=1 Tax=Pseudo-nitzschia australis TaxID=44445 RepID=A0A6V0AGG1_9STRA|mmetsp:Transcript_6626/g.14103  ORF Transcript_6626/g.14103 Transcript_6626/m.14103 type:complete len:622 (+) Transcript_6626:69-1934(+)
MVTWEAIEDLGVLPTRVWLSRPKLEDENAVNQEKWEPLRKGDCFTLNKQTKPYHPVLIENGRATADAENGIISANFVARSPREMVSCTWFVVKEERNDKHTSDIKPLLEPMPIEHSERVENLYQRAIYAASTYGDGIEPILKETLGLDDKYYIQVRQERSHYVMRKIPQNVISRSLQGSFKLQRGYGSYISEGEQEEDMLGPLNHVVFVVHGIGEAWFSKDKASSMVEQMDQLRLSFQKRQIADWKQKCEAAKKKLQPPPDPPNRVEFLPILWYHKVHNKSSAMTKSLMSVTLNTIPALRSIANDVVLDVLLYMTPNYCHAVLNSVTDEIFSVKGKIEKTFPNFSKKGKFSLIGHSLGSVICWDLLSLKKNSMRDGDNEHGVHIVASKTASNASNIAFIEETSSDEGETFCANAVNENGGGAWGPLLPKALERVLPFEPDFTMFMGSPIGLFLSLRGAHAVFDAIRDAHSQKPLISPFTLPTGAVYNIFSPSDPVAYRLEPLLLKYGTKNFPDPLYLTRLGGGVRGHVKVMQYVDGVIGRLWSKKSVNDKEEAVDENASLNFPLGGHTTRLDYQLQPGFIENEYLSAVKAHSTYFQNTDIIDFVIDVTGREGRIVIDLTID